MAQKTKILLVAGIAIILFSSGYIAGCSADGKRSQRDLQAIAETEARAARYKELADDARESNKQLEQSNIRLADELAKSKYRADVIATITSEIRNYTDNAIKGIDSAIRINELLESAISIYLDGRQGP